MENDEWFQLECTRQLLHHEYHKNGKFYLLPTEDPNLKAAYVNDHVAILGRQLIDDDVLYQRILTAQIDLIYSEKTDSQLTEEELYLRQNISLDHQPCHLDDIPDVDMWIKRVFNPLKERRMGEPTLRNNQLQQLQCNECILTNRIPLVASTVTPDYYRIMGEVLKNVDMTSS
jgi:hypothetical protein